MQFTSFKNWLMESKKSSKKTEYGCVMLYAKIPDWKKRISLVEKEDIFDDEINDYGYERTPHVTLIFGIHLDETEPENIEKFIKTFTPIEVTIDTISSFNNEKFDVVKYDVPVIEKLKSYHDALVANFPNTQTFPDYHPHMTIAYTLPGTAKKYTKKIKPFNVKFDTAVYSYALKGEDKKKRIKIKLIDES